MKHLISPEEAEKAASQFTTFTKKSTTEVFEYGYIKATEAANAKYNESVTPVLEKCKGALEKSYAEIKYLHDGIGSPILTQIESTLQTINSLLQ